MNWEGKSREEIESQLRDALEQARIAYVAARAQRKLAAEVAADDSLAPPDSIHAARLRNRKDDATLRALERYRGVLTWFTQFAVTGKPPKDFEP
jgi:hypothetical protein